MERQQFSEAVPNEGSNTDKSIAGSRPEKIDNVWSLIRVAMSTLSSPDAGVTASITAWHFFMSEVHE